MPARKKKAPVTQTDRVLKEFTCLAHGDFEAYKPVCPQGCDTVERVFRTPHAIGGQSKNIDKTFDALAKDFNLTDMRNDMGSVMASMRRGQTDFNPKWGSMPVIKPGEAGNAIAGSIGGARMSEEVSADGRGLSVFGQSLEAPRAIPHSPQHVDRTDIRTVKPA